MLASPTGGSHTQHILSSEGNSITLQPHQRLLSVGNTLTLSSPNSSGIPIQTMRLSKKRLDDKKTCRWVLDNGTICGKAFSKFDSLRRHVQELHKGIRPFVCSMCDKSYGRRDYLDRHLKTHTADASGICVGEGDSYVGGDQSGSCSVSVSVCGDEEDEDGHHHGHVDHEGHHHGHEGHHGHDMDDSHDMDDGHDQDMDDVHGQDMDDVHGHDMDDGHDHDMDDGHDQDMDNVHDMDDEDDDDMSPNLSNVVTVITTDD